MNTKTAKHVIAVILMGAIVVSGCLNSPEVVRNDVQENSYVDRQMPATTITQPTNSSIVSGTVEIVAEAVDNIGIDHVEFYLDNAILDDGFDDSAPYAHEWNTSSLQDSSEHTLYVIAFDTSLNQSCSDTIVVCVYDYQAPQDKEAPFVRMIMPLDGDTIAGIYTILAHGSDNVGIKHVEFYLDGVIPEDGMEFNAPYEHVWDTSVLANGSTHTIVAKIVDTSDNMAFSDTVHVTIDDSVLPPPDMQAPSVAVVTPSNGATVGGNVYILAEAVDNVAVHSVEFLIDGVRPSGSTKFTSPYEYLWNASTLANGTVHSIIARATDKSDNTAYSDTIRVTINNLLPPPPDTQAPSASIVAPAEGAEVSGSVLIRASASDNVGIKHVEYYLDGDMLPGGIDQTTPYEYMWDTTVLPDGTAHVLTVKAVDTSDNAALSSPVHLTVDNYIPPAPDTQAPSVSVTTPSEDATVSGSVQIVAEAADNVEVDYVEFLIDGVQPAGGMENNPPYEYFWSTAGLTNGSAHTIVARATDTSNNVAVSSAIHVTIDNTSHSPSGVVLLEDLSNRQVFPSNNWWNLDVASAPIDNNSQNFINWIGSGRTLHADFGGPPYGIPYVCVPGNQALRPVYFYSYGSESDDGAPGQPAGYPIPNEAYLNANYIEGGVAGGGNSGDRHLLVIDRDKWLLFELFGTHWNSSLQRWEAASGAVFNLATNDRRPEGWTSTDAAGLAVFPGLIRYDEVYGSNEIEHALRFTARASNGYVWPASHAAGTTTGALPMGARLRLKASVNISGYSPAVQKIFRAMKKYGLILADNGSDMYIQGTMDGRWDIGQINAAFHGMPASNFEVIQRGWDPVNN